MCKIKQRDTHKILTRILHLKPIILTLQYLMAFLRVAQNTIPMIEWNPKAEPRNRVTMFDQ